MPHTNTTLLYIYTYNSSLSHINYSPIPPFLNFTMPSSSSLTFLLSLLFPLFFLLPPSSPKPIKLSLRHLDSAKNLTKLQRLQHALHRSNPILHKFSAAADAATPPKSSVLQSPVSAGTGAYLMTLSIGTPPLQYAAVLDTGSDLIWTQCLPCSQCYSQPTPIFDPTKSSSFKTLSCFNNSLCNSLPSSSCTHQKTCNYVYSYGDYSSTQGILASETFTFDKVSVFNIGFGCGDDNEGDGFNQASGLVGLGRGPLSLISQLDEPRFSYCLTSMDEPESSTSSSSSSTLFLGSFPRIDNNNVTLISTSLVSNPSLSSFYYLPLEGISVGETRVRGIDEASFAIKEDGSGGVIIDSGTTITYLEESAYVALRKEFVSQTNLAVDDSGSTGLDLCFSADSDSSEVRIPKKMVFHFGGGADLEIPSENFLVGDVGSDVVCLAMGGSRGLSIFGNVQQQNVLVNYDLKRETISFAPMRCDEL